MNITPLKIPGVLLIEPMIHKDNRGLFFESFNQREFELAIGESIQFVQDNHSYSIKNVIRGLHYQTRKEQGKLVRVVLGKIYDVAVDIRKNSPTFGQWVANELSAENNKQVWIPRGFAHGFAVMSNEAVVLYKTSDYWSPGDERCILWSDSKLAIPWPVDGNPIISKADEQGESLEI